MWSAFCLKSSFLSDFEPFWVRRLLFLITERQGRNPCFERAPAPERFFPRKSHRSAFKLCSKKRSLSYNGSVLWNSLSLKMRQLTSLNVFKGKLKNFNLDICNLCTRPPCKPGFLLLYLCYCCHLMYTCTVYVCKLWLKNHRVTLHPWACHLKWSLCICLLAVPKESLGYTAPMGVPPTVQPMLVSSI